MEHDSAPSPNHATVARAAAAAVGGRGTPSVDFEPATGGIADGQGDESPEFSEMS